MNATYPLPNCAYKAWTNLDRETATNWQLAMVEAVRNAIHVNKLFYAGEVYDHVLAIFRAGGWINEEDLSRGIKRVERGDFGMEVYYARQTMERWDEEDSVVSLKGHFLAGNVFKAIRMNGTRYSTAEVLEASDPFNIKVKLTKRGSRNRWHATINAHCLKAIVDQSKLNAS